MVLGKDEEYMFFKGKDLNFIEENLVRNSLGWEFSEG